MKILGIESSCDETGAAILEKKGQRVTILSNILSSSALLQSKYGGVIPEQAAREQLKVIIPVIEAALREARCEVQDIDAIAVTQGPGLIGSLLVGVETAKTLSWVWKKPLVAVNHLLGHFYANFISGAFNNSVVIGKSPAFPFIGLLVSGGHTDLVLFRNHDKYEYLGGTRDDAAGECFDKCARLLGLSYPGGPQISKLALSGNPKAYKLPRPMIDSDDFDFSFSGLKTAVSNLLVARGGAEEGFHRDARSDNEDARWNTGATGPRAQELNDLCASIEGAIVDSLVKKTTHAAQSQSIDQIIVAGGVAANGKLISQLKNSFKGKVVSPPTELCTDNAAMIASRAFFETPLSSPLTLQADPSLTLATLKE